MILTISFSAFAGGEGEAAASKGAASGKIAKGNVIFLHPDGTGLNHWNTGRMYWYGPDGILNWDRMTEMNAYRGHMANRLTGTSHGGATVHAFGYKVQDNSFGLDRTRRIYGLSGFEGSIMREALAAGMPVGLVNDGVGELTLDEYIHVDQVSGAGPCCSVTAKLWGCRFSSSPRWRAPTTCPTTPTRSVCSTRLSVPMTSSEQ